MVSVYLFIPNLIGYSRVLFCIASAAYAFSDPTLSVVFYFAGQGMDAIDGVAARHFKQTSQFGAVLDMLTDRMGTSVLLFILSHLYPGAWGFFAFLFVLDIVAHWLQMYSSLVVGKKTHKGGNNFLVNFYYGHPTLFLTCCGNEFFFMCLYLNAFPEWSGMTFTLAGATLGYLRAILYLLFPIFAFKNFMNLVQLVDAVEAIVAIDEQNRAKTK